MCVCVCVSLSLSLSLSLVSVCLCVCVCVSACLFMSLYVTPDPFAPSFQNQLVQIPARKSAKVGGTCCVHGTDLSGIFVVSHLSLSSLSLSSTIRANASVPFAVVIRFLILHLSSLLCSICALRFQRAKKASWPQAQTRWQP